MADNDSREGYVLCVRHANQWAKGEPFSGRCDPGAVWTGGDEREVVCDVLADTL